MEWLSVIREVLFLLQTFKDFVSVKKQRIVGTQNALGEKGALTINVKKERCKLRRKSFSFQGVVYFPL